jgi:uncharacterized protein (DUF1330 family)
MAKGYWVASVDVSDFEAYKKYIAANRVAFRKYRARYITRGGQSEVAEGKGRSRIVIIEFKDYATARACYDSSEYAEAMAVRKACAAEDIVIVEGYDGPQLTDE